MAGYTKKDISKLCKGRTAEQQAVIKYFLTGGCLSKTMSDQEYDSLVQQKVKSMNFKQRALNKIGLDESEVSEIPPVHFEGYHFDERKTYAKPGQDRKWRSSAYQVSWIFFSDTQVYLYQYTLNMDEDSKKEITEEYFYKDVTAVATASDTIEKADVLEKVNCKGEATYSRRTIDTDLFKLATSGGSFYCAMDSGSVSEDVIQGMKAKLREKKL